MYMSRVLSALDVVLLRWHTLPWADSMTLPGTGIGEQNKLHWLAGKSKPICGCGELQ